MLSKLTVFLTIFFSVFSSLQITSSPTQAGLRDKIQRFLPIKVVDESYIVGNWSICSKQPWPLESDILTEFQFLADGTYTKSKSSRIPNQPMNRDNWHNKHVLETGKYEITPLKVKSLSGRTYKAKLQLIADNLEAQSHSLIGSFNWGKLIDRQTHFDHLTMKSGSNSSIYEFTRQNRATPPSVP